MPFTCPSQSSQPEAPPFVASSSSSGDGRPKTGRPNKWTLKRQRRLARLSLYSTIKREDVPKVLHEDDWEPGSVEERQSQPRAQLLTVDRKESTVETLSSLLDNHPRWLRPRDREEMDNRITGLPDRAKVRKAEGKIVLETSTVEGLGDAQLDERNEELELPFSEIPLEGLLDIPAECSFGR
jgi:hypothetical protein